MHPPTEDPYKGDIYLVRLCAREAHLVAEVAILLHLPSVGYRRLISSSPSFLANSTAKSSGCNCRTNCSCGLFSSAIHYCPARANSSSSRCASYPTSLGAGPVRAPG